MICQLRQRLRLGYANADLQVRTLQNRFADLLAKISQVPAITNPGEITKGLINGIYFDARAYFFQRGHYPAGHVSVKFVVTAEANHAGAPEQVFLLKVWRPHGNASGFGLCAARYHATVVI